MKKIRELTKGCAFREGKGNPDGRLMVVFKTPDMEGKNMVRNFLEELDIPGGDIYATSFVKKKEYTDAEMRDILYGEIAAVQPDLIWPVGSVIRKVGIDIPWEIGFGMYVPFGYSDLLSVMFPSEKMVSEMPEEIRLELWNRLKAIAKDYKGDGPSTENRFDSWFFKNFCDDFDIKFNEHFKSIYSNNLHTYVHITKNKKVKDLFSKEVPFGVAMTRDEFNEVKNNEDFLDEVLETFDGKIKEVI